MKCPNCSKDLQFETYGHMAFRSVTGNIAYRPTTLAYCDCGFCTDDYMQPSKLSLELRTQEGRIRNDRYGNRNL